MNHKEWTDNGKPPTLPVILYVRPGDEASCRTLWKSSSSSLTEDSLPCNMLGASLQWNMNIITQPIHESWFILLALTEMKSDGLAQHDLFIHLFPAQLFTKSASNEVAE